MYTDWEAKYPLVTIHALERCIEALSDHCPLLLTAGAHRTKKKHQFKFEHGWFFREGFYDMVKEVSDMLVTSQTPIQRWNNKIRATRRYLRGWAWHTYRFYKRKRHSCHQLSMTSTR
jgi:hypothetical protein